MRRFLPILRKVHIFKKQPHIGSAYGSANVGHQGAPRIWCFEARLTVLMIGRNLLAESFVHR